MSCGTCGTDAPHGDKNEDGGKCMACECPCEEHKEHTHGHEEHHEEGEHHKEEEHHEEKPSGVCESCGSHGDCGCA